jgi:hypothetical protein
MMKILFSALLLYMASSIAQAQLQLQFRPLRPLNMSRYAPINVRQFPALGLQQTVLRPNNAKVRRELSGLNLTFPSSGGLSYWDKGLNRQGSGDSLLLNNGSLLVSLLGQNARYVMTEPGGLMQPYFTVSAGVLGGYLQLPKSLGRSGMTFGTQAKASVGIFLGRSVQLETGYQYTGKMRGVNLSGSYTSFRVRF